MSLKRAYCIKCQRKHDKLRVFEVNPEASICYCPHCMAKLEPSEAIEAYDNLIQKLLKEARITLYQKTDFAQAYTMFAHIIEIDESNVDARFGRIISLLYMSKLRRSRFLDSELMIKEESQNIFHKAIYHEKYAYFLRKINLAVDEYHENFKKKVSVKNYFFDDECVKLLFKRDIEIKEIKEFLLNEANWLYAKHETKEIKELIDLLEASIKDVEKELKTKMIATDGYAYGLAGFSTDGNALLGHDTKKKDIRLKHFSMRSLGNSDKKTKIIQDDVYPDHMHLYGFANQILVWIIINAVLTCASAVCFMLIKTKPFDFACAITAGFFGISTIILVILMILAKNKLKKSRESVSGGGKKVS